MHHPPIVTGMAWVDEIGLPATDIAALAALLERSPQVKLVVGGHIHRAASTVLGGCAVVTCASTNIQGRLDFEATEMVLALEPPSILVHAWLGAEFVTHVHPVRSEPI
jgi:Icc-related predicted phosphoesterase